MIANIKWNQWDHHVIADTLLVIIPFLLMVFKTQWISNISALIYYPLKGKK